MSAMETLIIFARAATNQTAVTTYRNQCTLETCPITDGYFYYRPSLGANATFCALFALSLLGYLLQVTLSRRFIGFTVAMVSGCILEVLGYVGRILGYQNPFNQNSFLIQIVCLTIAPSFLAAGLYLTLSRVVMTFGHENSRIAPLSYPRIFIPCDILSLLLQATGGGMASTASHQNKSVDLGDHILVAGLAFQVLTLLIFICLFADFTIRTIRRMQQLGEDALDPTHAKLRASWSFKGFLVALALATFCIFVRSVYRVVELGEGWEGALIRNQNTFIGLEGIMVIVAVLSLNAFHPGLCFREGYDHPVAKNVKSKKARRAREEQEAANAAAAEKGSTGEESKAHSSEEVGITTA